jgi:hypothetical protein
MLQERILEEMQAEDTQEEYKKLCQLRGIIVQEVEELNELKETKLMAAAAEGRYTPQHNLGISLMHMIMLWRFIAVFSCPCTKLNESTGLFLSLCFFSRYVL